MKRSRALLLGVAMVLIAWAGRSQAKAEPCYPCLCDEACGAAEQRCYAACDGNSTCQATCERELITCEEGCE
jgi:hypothetical protein